MSKRVVKSLILIGGLIITSVYADDIVISKPAGYTGTGPEQIIIQDRNLGATSNDITSEDSFGYYFQWGNNHGLSPDSPTTKEKVERNEAYAHKGYNGGDSFILHPEDCYMYDGLCFEDWGSYWSDGITYHNLRGGDYEWSEFHVGFDDIENMTVIEKTALDRQGPCDDGYHVPSAWEWNKVFEYWCINNSDKCSIENIVGSEAHIGEDFRIALNIPFGGHRSLGDGRWITGWDKAFLWSSTPRGAGAGTFEISSSYVHKDTSRGLSEGLNVRCFKNPDIIITRPAGYNGKGPEKIVIQSMNVGASKSDPYGKYFQRGNNYGFSSSETPTVVDEGLTWNASYSHKGYESTNWIDGSNYDVWADKSHHDDVWGGENDNASNNWGLDIILETQKYRQGPCDKGYHVPSAGEWSKIIEYRALSNGQAVQGSDLKYFSNFISRERFVQDLLLPLAGERASRGSVNSQGINVSYWSSSPYGSDKPKEARSLFVDYVDGVAVDDSSDKRSSGEIVRCFKNYDADSFHSYNLNYTTLIMILISFGIGGGVGFCIYHHCTKRRSKSQ